ncbi:MAG: hypothetical protein AAF288_07315 [Planctomycetota bacterium]
MRLSREDKPAPFIPRTIRGALGESVRQVAWPLLGLFLVGLVVSSLVWLFGGGPTPVEDGILTIEALKGLLWFAVFLASGVFFVALPFVLIAKLARRRNRSTAVPSDVLRRVS